MSPSAVLVVGVPRSGSTWIGQVLGRADGCRYVGEPDNEEWSPIALGGKRRLGRFPVLEEDDQASAYLRIWKQAFGAADARFPRIDWRARAALRRARQKGDFRAAFDRIPRKDTRRLRAASVLASAAGSRPDGLVPVVKSVHAALSLEWIARSMRPSVIVVVRDPHAIVASTMRLGMPDRDRRLDDHPRIRALIRDGRLPAAPTDARPFARAAWQLGVMYSGLASAVRRHPQWIVARHEDLCEDPRTGFRLVAARLGLGWTPDMDRFLAEHDAHGEGFATFRVASSLPGQWQRQLSSAQLTEIDSTLETFPGEVWTFEGAGEDGVGISPPPDATPAR